jgi:hypothetical protein
MEVQVIAPAAEHKKGFGKPPLIVKHNADPGPLPCPGVFRPEKISKDWAVSLVERVG